MLLALILGFVIGWMPSGYLFAENLSTASSQIVSTRRLNSWVERQTRQSTRRFLGNISPSDALEGTVVASQQRQDPPYYFHWVRDASLTMQTLLDLYVRQGYRPSSVVRHIEGFAKLARLHQTLADHLGEVKFHPNGEPYRGPWCRPQNDGPALRALALTEWAHMLMGQGQVAKATALYDGQLPSTSAVKTDLEFVAHHWRDPSCDLWEEVMGDHFYTRMVQRRALVEGARLARRLGDPAAADFYDRQADEIGRSIFAFWKADENRFVAHLNVSSDRVGKQSNLDTSFVLGLLHGDAGDDFLPLTDPRVIATVEAQEALYGTAIGRYPEDQWEGGHAWFLLTEAFANYYYRAGKEFIHQGREALARRFFSKGEALMSRIYRSSRSDGALAEQFNEQTGEPASVFDLTWSHTEFLQAVWSREDLMLSLGLSPSSVCERELVD